MLVQELHSKYTFHKNYILTNYQEVMKIEQVGILK